MLSSMSILVFCKPSVNLSSFYQGVLEYAYIKQNLGLHRQRGRFSLAFFNRKESSGLECFSISKLVVSLPLSRVICIVHFTPCDLLGCRNFFLILIGYLLFVIYYL